MKGEAIEFQAIGMVRIEKIEDIFFKFYGCDRRKVSVSCHKPQANSYLKTLTESPLVVFDSHTYIL